MQIWHKYPNFWIIMGLLAGVTWLFTGCADSASQIDAAIVQPTATPTVELSGRGSGGTLRLLYWQAPTILNPHLTTGIKDWEACRITYEPLASYDPEGKNLIPFLAAEIPSLENGGVAPDFKSVTWKLKQGVKWSDGQPFTAADVRFTYEFITNKDTAATTTANYEAIDNIEVIDDLTVKLNFKEPNPAWAVPFVGIRGMILPHHVFEAYNGLKAKDAPANLLPVGTGPYFVETFKPQEVLFLGSDLVKTYKIVYKPNPYFREADKPYFSRVELRGGGTANEAARSVLDTGEVDFAWNLQLDAKSLAQFEQVAGKGRVITVLGPGVERIVLNLSDPNKETADGERSFREFPNPILSDKKVRQALAYAIDREAIAELSLGARPTSNLLVAPDVYNSPNTTYEFNLEKAKALLDEAGWTDDTDKDGFREKNGVEMSLLFQTSANTARQQVQELVRQALADIGIRVEPRVIDAGVFFGGNQSNPQTLERFYADMEEYFALNQNPDPGSYMKNWTSDQIPQKANKWQGQNVARWDNPQYDALYQQSTTELDPEKRQQLFIQMNDLIVNEVVLIPLFNRAQVSGVSQTLEGVDINPWDAELWNIKDWRRKP